MHSLPTSVLQFWYRCSIIYKISGKGALIWTNFQIVLHGVSQKVLWGRCSKIDSFTGGQWSQVHNYRGPLQVQVRTGTIRMCLIARLPWSLSDSYDLHTATRNIFWWILQELWEFKRKAHFFRYLVDRCILNVLHFFICKCWNLCSSHSMDDITCTRKFVQSLAPVLRNFAKPLVSASVQQLLSSILV